jgi:GT2 family glycosyltransferase
VTKANRNAASGEAHDGDVCVAVLAHNRRQQCERLLRELVSGFASLAPPRPRLVLVDNGSTDATYEMAQQLASEAHTIGVELHCVRCHHNVWAAEGRNVGVLTTTAAYVVCLDDDVVIAAGALSGIARFFTAEPRAAVLSFLIREAETGIVLNDHGSGTELGVFYEAAFALRREAFAEVGGFDPQCRFGAEGMDLTMRLRERGWRVVYVPEVEVLHPRETRPRAVDLERRRRWVHAYARVFAKNLPLPHALLFSVRLLMSSAWVSTPLHGCGAIASLVGDAVRGYRSGMSVRRPISRQSARLYLARDFRPDIGNVPVLWKLARVLMRQARSAMGREPFSARTVPKPTAHTQTSTRTTRQR